MADLRTSFTVLEDSTTQAGVPLHKVVETDLAAGKNAIPALVAKNAAGELKYIKVNAQGELVVSLESGDYALLSDSGTHAGNAAYQDLVVIDLIASKTYRDLEVLVSCFRDAVFQVVHKDNATETVLVNGVRCGAGSLNEMAKFIALEFVAGATGTQSLVVRGKNLNALSTMDATASIKEIQ